MNKLYNLMSFITAASLIVVMLITSLDLIAYYYPGFYEKEYRKYNVQDAVKMEMSDILYVTDEMMDYLKGYREDLVVETTVDGEPREFFNDREKSHMYDVQVLFLGGIKLRRWLLLLAVFCLGTIGCMEEKPVRRLAKAYLAAAGVFLAAAGGIAYCFMKDFYHSFVKFHHIFFTNDLWLLDPKTDLLINILPQGFFMDFALHMGVVFAVMLIGGALISIIYLVVQKVKLEKKYREEDAMISEIN